MKKAFKVIVTLIVTVLTCMAATCAVRAESNVVSFSEKDGTLTIGAGEVKKEDVQSYKKQTKRVIVKSGAVFPEDCSRMFNKFEITEIDLTKADTSKVKNISGMFMDCQKLKAVNMSGTDLTKVQNANAMFIRCTALESIDLAVIDTPSLIHVESMFEDCTSLKTLDLSYLNTAKVESWSCMFKGCSSLRTIYVSDRWTGVKDTYQTTWLLEPLFTDCVNIKGGNGTTYDADANEDKIYARADKKDAPGYLTYKAVKETSTAEDTADNRIKAPAKVYYKLVNHDKVSLKWDAVPDADGYKVYKLDESTGASKEEANLTKTSYSLNDLKPYTQYTYGVSVIKKTGDKTEESPLCKVSFTTPEKWYYTHGNGKDYDDPDYDGSNLFRHHYDGSGTEKFDPFPMIKAFDDEMMYSLMDVKQYEGYVYLYLYDLGVDDMEQIDVFRFKNSGKGMEKTRLYSCPDRRLFIDTDTAYFGFNSYQNNAGEDRSITQGYVEKVIKNKDGILSPITIFEGVRTCISNFVTDEEYIYYFASPYRYDGKYVEEPYVPYDDTAYLYRTPLDEPKEPTYDNWGRFNDPPQDEITECISKMPYPYAENGIDIIGLRDGMIYFIIRDVKNSDNKYPISFYRVSVAEKDTESVKLCTMKLKKYGDIQLIGDKIYVFGDNKGYTIPVNGDKHNPKKLFSVKEGFFYEYYMYSAEISDQKFEITDDYIFITDANKEVFYRINIDGTNVVKRDKPFEWR